MGRAGKDEVLFEKKSTKNTTTRGGKERGGAPSRNLIETGLPRMMFIWGPGLVSDRLIQKEVGRAGPKKNYTPDQCTRTMVKGGLSLRRLRMGGKNCYKKHLFRARPVLGYSWKRLTE